MHRIWSIVGFKYWYFLVFYYTLDKARHYRTVLTVYPPASDIHLVLRLFRPSISQLIVTDESMRGLPQLRDISHKYTRKEDMTIDLSPTSWT
jgi:hypothetical protein